MNRRSISSLTSRWSRPMYGWRERFTVNSWWLVRLRWVAVVGQLLTIGFVAGILKIDIPLVSLLIILALTATSNILFANWLRTPDSSATVTPSDATWGPTAIMGLDLILLTAMLYFTGGPTNPFSFFFFVNLSLCAFVLNRAAAWALNGLAVACFTLLLVAHTTLPQLQPAPDLSPIRQLGSITLLHWGVWIAFVACSSIIVDFTSRLHQKLQFKERELREAETLQARSEKLEALGTLAAGAAHELGSPLSTIAVVSRELEKQLDQNPMALQDIKLVHSEVQRCRRILQRLSHDAGHAIGESLKVITAQQLLDLILDELPTADNVKLNLEPTAATSQLQVPPTGLAQALRGLVKNALDASPPGLSVVVSGTLENQHLRIEIKDRGEGMQEQTLNRLSEPFFTTKEPGQGMGLGVFLARTTIQRLGGELAYQSKPLQGTVAVVTLPTVKQTHSAQP